MGAFIHLGMLHLDLVSYARIGVHSTYRVCPTFLFLSSPYMPPSFSYTHTHTGSVDPPSSELSSQEGEAMDQETAEEQDGEQTKRGPQEDEPERRQQQVKRWHNLLLHPPSL